MSREAVNDAVSAALALRELEKAGRASGIDLAMRDRILMAEEIERLRGLMHDISDYVRNKDHWYAIAIAALVDAE